MPVPVPSELQLTVVDKASLFPSFARAALEADPIKANLFLPTLTKCITAEYKGEPLQDQWWIIVHCIENVVFIVSCTDGYMGKYPLFFFTPLTYAQLHPDTITPPLVMVAQALRRHVSPRRVYSVFAPEIVTQVFSNIWSGVTHIKTEPEAYYHALISYLTAETLINKATPPISGAECELRLGRPGDLQAIAQLCYLFAEDSPPFTLSMEGAMLEANILLHKQEVFVYTVRYPDGSRRIASIVATTRNTDTTATITKVFTHPDFRGRGCAERLVRWVCKKLLAINIRYVVLFVGIENKAAKVYQKVGFVGVGDNARPAHGVEPWLELGFDRNQVRLGHW
ncbi:hypothetical protein GALMADRAFT_68480 [Galerina marginata CBS 339.88]|uniref:N-acetyltransferase domain-containing protein n=1 Tax=Galerina marginata (strain CBS 339.88) TaxID=685588 RepID=A0A067T6J3_GALM3|nr:hypothetical protein GALMADRAFT_68480 [Galerina marginata CBS 339.88]